LRRKGKQPYAVCATIKAFNNRRRQENYIGTIYTYLQARSGRGSAQLLRYREEFCGTKKGKQRIAKTQRTLSCIIIQVLFTIKGKAV
jgi:hypothetical protein